MGRTVLRGRSKGRRVSDEGAEAEGIWGPLPPERYPMGTRTALWLLALAVLVIISYLVYGL